MATIIYLIRFHNQKAYIGMTRRSLAQRLYEHRQAAKDRVQTPLYTAWRRYQIMRCRVLAIVEDKMGQETERRAIEVFKTRCPDGYNKVEGGIGGSRTKGSKLTAEHRARISASNRERWKTPGFKERVVAKISASLQGRKTPPEVIAKRSATQRANYKPRSPEFLQKLSERQKESWIVRRNYRIARMREARRLRNLRREALTFK